MEEIEVPEYFICPISLQIMKDPVTGITGITYDRESIEHWLFKSKNTTCPVTKQPLPKDSDLTPNHTLRRLIQAWCTSHGVDRIPTPKPPLTKFHVLKLIRDLSNPRLQLKTLTQLELLAAENQRNRKHMVEAGTAKAMVSFIVTCFSHGQIAGLEQALSILHLIRIPKAEINYAENYPILESLTWVLDCKLDDYNHVPMKTHAVLVLRKIIQTTAQSNLLEILKPEFFNTIVSVIKDGNIFQQGINGALQIMLEVCPWGRNQVMMVEANAVFELIELELKSPEKQTTELILGVLFHLCCCAEGRAQLLSHRKGIAMVSKRILKVSPEADDRAILILSLISKYSTGTSIVAEEMLRVGVVSKLFTVLQVDCPIYLKDKAQEILKSHMSVWKNSPCI